MDHADASGAIELLTSRGADRLEHPGGTLLSHLQRTAARLASWGASHALTAAGLCHAAYGTQGFPTALLPLDQRELLRTVIGDDAEAIVYAYCASDREFDARSGGELRDRFSGDYWVPSEPMRRALAELTAANELDVVEQAPLSSSVLAAIGGNLARTSASLSLAAWSAVLRTALLRDAVAHAGGPRGDDVLAYRELGRDGPRLVLWHGGAGPELTWSRQHALSDAYALRIPWRRGYAPSTPTGRQDWEPDVHDLLRVMPDRAHVVAHSYGGLSALLAACLAPERFASLIIIEAPLWSLAPEDPEVQQLASLAREFARGAPEAREAFLALAGLPADHEQTRRLDRRARAAWRTSRDFFRDPSEARFELGPIRAAALPVALVSGGYAPAIERLARECSERLRAEHWSIPGAGHAVQRVPEFNERVRAFVASRE